MTPGTVLAVAGGEVPAGVEIDIALACDDWQAALSLERAETTARRAAAAALASLAVPYESCELSIVLSDDATVQGLNRDWRGRDAPTNVLAFPGDSEPVAGQPLLLGDVIVAFGVTRAEADRDGKSLADHLSHLIVHGTLHLLGYDHENEAEAQAMEALETRILADLGIADPYAEGPDSDVATEPGDG
jgi:probable rRNA maturation factor